MNLSGTAYEFSVLLVHDTGMEPGLCRFSYMPIVRPDWTTWPGYWCLTGYDDPGNWCINGKSRLWRADFWLTPCTAERVRLSLVGKS
jgi:hypothetical protein